MIGNDDVEQIERLNSRVAELLAEVAALKHHAQRAPKSVADALRKSCGATNGCSCADLNYQWYGPGCEATMTSVFRTMLAAGETAVSSTVHQGIEKTEGGAS